MLLAANGSGKEKRYDWQLEWVQHLGYILFYCLSFYLLISSLTLSTHIIYDIQLPGTGGWPSELPINHTTQYHRNTIAKLWQVTPVDTAIMQMLPMSDSWQYRWHHKRIHRWWLEWSADSPRRTRPIKQPTQELWYQHLLSWMLHETWKSSGQDGDQRNTYLIQWRNHVERY